MSRTKTSHVPLTSPGTRFVANDSNTTKRPFGVMPRALWLGPLPWPPPEETLTRIVFPVPRSRSKMSVTVFVSPCTRSEAFDSNTTYRPVPAVVAP